MTRIPGVAPAWELEVVTAMQSAEHDVTVVPVFVSGESMVAPCLEQPQPHLPGLPDSRWCLRHGFGARRGESLVLASFGGAAGDARERATGDSSGAASSAAGSQPVRTVVLAGLGDSGSVDADAWRKAGAAISDATSSARSCAVDLRGVVPPPGAGAVFEGMRLAGYSYDTHKTVTAPADGPAARRGFDRVTMIVDPEEEERATADARRGVRIAEAVVRARDLVNAPASEMTPSRLAEVARAMAESNPRLSLEVWERDDIARERLGGLLGVSRGSEEPPVLIRLTYEPRDPAGSRATVHLVGKGITFDSGGLSLKSPRAMTTMKTDMAGAAAVLCALDAAADLDLPVRAVAIVPAAENLPSGRATKPGDVLTVRNGKTIEVLNTDAEGRLVLADGLCLAAEAAPDAIVDVATLTGACVTALGPRIAGLMGNDQHLVDELRSAADRAGEAVWPLPLPVEYRRHIDSDVADLKNVGLPEGSAGAIAAALLLQEFCAGARWAHLDIAGPARSDADDGVLRKGGTGFGVRTLIELLSAYSLR